MGLHHCHHGLKAHSHPCRFGVVHYELEEPFSRHERKRRIGYTTVKNSQGINYFPIKHVLPALPMTELIENNNRFQILATQQFSDPNYLSEVRYRPIDIFVDCSKLENETWIPSSDMEIYESSSRNQLNLNLSFYFKDNELHISVEDVMKIISLDNYYKRVTLDSKNCYRFEVTTQTHAEIDRKGDGFDISDAAVWTLWRAIIWKAQTLIPWTEEAAKESIHNFKIEWIRSYRDVIKVAANEYKIPAFLLAGILYVEVGGQPHLSDFVTFFFRDTFTPKVLTGIANLLGGDLRRLPGALLATSFGDISMQIRVAAEVLNYPNPNSVSRAETFAIIDSLIIPEIGLFICAKHLLNLKNVDFPNLSMEELTDEHIRITSSRYNWGAHVTLETIQNNSYYGDRILDNKEFILDALK